MDKTLKELNREARHQRFLVLWEKIPGEKTKHKMAWIQKMLEEDAGIHNAIFQWRSGRRHIKEATLAWLEDCLLAGKE